jgi:quercetin dioxygenase-like cupin family protein
MSHVTIPDVEQVVAIQPGSVVSKVIHRDEALDVSVFGFDTGEGLTGHSASRPAIVQVISGQLRFSVEGEEIDAGPGAWIHMSAGTEHSLTAEEPTVMLLVLVRT